MAILRESDIETRACRYGLISFFKNDTIISRSLREYGEWAQAEIEFLLDFIRSGDTVLDVGAFIGTHTIAFAERVSIGGNVYAFEPQPMFFEVLKKNVGQNVLNNVRLFNWALSDEVRQGTIHEADVRDPGNFAGTSLKDSGFDAPKVAGYHEIEVMTLDQLIIEKCDLIKIDTEEMELNVLKGSQRTLQTSRPIVMAECNSIQYGWPVVEFMKEKSYCAYLLNVRAFNSNNFRRSESNFLGDGREAGLVLVPEERHSVLQDQFKRYPFLIPISCLDDLALGLLKKPQYKYEVMAKVKAANVLGVGFWANESEVERFRREIVDLKSAAEGMRDQINSIDTTIEAERQIMAEREKDLSNLNELVKQKDAAQARLMEEAKQFQATIGAQQQTIAEREKDLSSLNELVKQNAEREKDLSNLNELVKQKDAAQARLMEEAKQFQATIGAQQQTIAEREKDLSNLNELVKQKDAAQARLMEEAKQFQATIGAQQQTIAEREKDLSSLNELIKQKEATHTSLAAELATENAILNAIYNSHGWKALLIYYGIRNGLLPEGSWRRNFAKRSFQFMLRLRKRFSKQAELAQASPVHSVQEEDKVLQETATTSESDQEVSTDVPCVSASCAITEPIIDEDVKGGDYEILAQRISAELAQASPVHSVQEEDKVLQETATTSESDHEVSTDVPCVSASCAITEPIIDEDVKGGDYEILAQRISALRQSRVENLSLKSPTLVSIGEGEIQSYVSSLVFPTVDKVQVSIVIPVFNHLRFTVECLISVMKYSGNISYETIVVDDGSSDQTPVVIGQIPNIIYLRNEENLGFIRTCNRGAANAKGEYLLFLNNDAQVTENWLSPLIESFKEYENVGAVGPKVLFPNGRLQEAGALVNRNGTSTLIGFSDDPELAKYNYLREVTYCSGACLLVETSKFRELGGFNVNLAPAYCEDWDLAFRLRQRGLRVLYNPKSVVVHHLSVTSNDVEETFKIGCVVRNQQKLSEKWQSEIDNLNKINMIAFYLPQFHPIPENDRWWGKGFTEWTNVSKAQPNFVGHYQPHLPADLGFYDLRVEEVMEQQAELAKRYGIHGFCYFYYWFAGKRLLDLPLERIMESKKSTIPFCLCWANENWTRKWDGEEHEVLIKQRHSDEDDRAVIRDLMRYMWHQNYIRIHGKPLLIIYRITLFPNIKRTTQIWRDLCLKEGLGEIYLAMAESFEHSLVLEHPSQYGFDASVEFPPHGMYAPINPPGEVLNSDFAGVIHDYRELVLKYLQRQVPGYVRFRSITPCWDNTPRRQNDPVILSHTCPEAYQLLLEAVLHETHEQNFGDERIVFINAWNEWGEGNHLEPDKRYGHGFLEATRNAHDAWLGKQEKGRLV